MKHVHLIGIGGTGLSAIAKVLLESGYEVTGSDREYSELAKAVERNGAHVFVGHRSENITGADVIVRSSAIPDTNPEVIAGIEAGIPVLKRKEFLGTLTQGYRVIAVAGTHGKTTTTSMLAWMLSELGRDPSFIVGGVVTNLETNAHAGKGEDFVIEADEYDRMFLGLTPEIAVITNVEHDHPDIYPLEEDFRQAFRDFVECVLPGGVVIGYGDHPQTAKLLDDAAALERIVYRFGFDLRKNDYCARHVQINHDGDGYRFDMVRGTDVLTEVALHIPGLHNVLNALAALVVVDVLSLPLDKAAMALEKFKGAERRFEIRGEVNGVVVVDDYAHHPTEILATIQAAKSRFPQRRLWVLWQPHTYSRTVELFDQFRSALQHAEHLVVMDIFAAREDKPEGFSIGKLVRDLHHPDVHLMPGIPEAAGFLSQVLVPGDVLLVMSAGDAIDVSKRVLRTLTDKRLTNGKPGKMAA